ncbi:hypothetical protein BT63DRAFT_474383 [Microthyrium microscopicum]|uniref:Uncharacterized protein n=1 Tax=Microthyrium microscopicum TaxID=703497 RepID=A0A6A6UT42_9PEZI|nr:hypothetical protein BT63DRAFT_474383 [Microthyrium microscopicum]
MSDASTLASNFAKVIPLTRETACAIRNWNQTPYQYAPPNYTRLMDLFVRFLEEWAVAMGPNDTRQAAQRQLEACLNGKRSGKTLSVNNDLAVVIGLLELRGGWAAILKRFDRVVEKAEDDDTRRHTTVYQYRQGLPTVLQIVMVQLAVLEKMAFEVPEVCEQDFRPEYFRKLVLDISCELIEEELPAVVERPEEPAIATNGT